jgi:hypothetical protein
MTNIINERSILNQSHAEAKKLKRRALALTLALIAIILVSFFAINEWFSNHQSTPEFFVGVEFAYSYNNVTGLKGLVSDLKDLVDEVKNYTNLFVIGTPEISFDQATLNETCDYIYDAGLHFIVLFTDRRKYPQDPFLWTIKARLKYGEKFLGVYRIDEPGGKQLDNETERFVLEAKNYTVAAETYVYYISFHLDDWMYATNNKVFTSDYGLYWFDYKAGYSAVFAEFGWNHSRQLNIALCRGAAEAQNKDWGTIVTWTYNDTPYIESEKELYDDMTLAYDAGAKYVVIFDYPKIGQYGILTEKHFDAMKDFWDYIHSNPQNFGVNEGRVAYVLPQDYGFGFRNPRDRIWGLWDADDLSQKVWDDTNKLLSQYSSRLDIVYNDPEFISVIQGRYERLFFWNETIA